MNEYYLYTFENTHSAIQTEKLLKPAGSRIMPVPRFISSSCGIAVMISPDMKESSEEIFSAKSELSPDDYAYYHIYRNEEGQQCDRLK